MPILVRCESRHSRPDKKKKNYALIEREPKLKSKEGTCTEMYLNFRVY